MFWKLHFLQKQEEKIEYPTWQDFNDDDDVVITCRWIVYIQRGSTSMHDDIPAIIALGLWWEQGKIGISGRLTKVSA